MAKGYIGTRTPRDIEQLVVWALVDNGLGNEFVEQDGRMDWRGLGVRVDGGAASDRWSVSTPRVQHEDAERIASAIRMLPDKACVLVVTHGRTNCRPDWCEEGVGKRVPKTNRRGQVEYHYEREGDRHSRKLGPKMQWIGETAERVDWFRARYAVWWAALEGMVEPLNDMLERFEAMPPSTPPEPWVTYGENNPLADAMAGDSLLRRSVIERVGPIDIRIEQEIVNPQAVESASR